MTMTMTTRRFILVSTGLFFWGMAGFALTGCSTLGKQITPSRFQAAAQLGAQAAMRSNPDLKPIFAQVVQDLDLLIASPNGFTGPQFAEILNQLPDMHLSSSYADLVIDAGEVLFNDLVAQEIKRASESATGVEILPYVVAVRNGLAAALTLSK